MFNLTGSNLAPQVGVSPHVLNVLNAVEDTEKGERDRPLPNFVSTQN